MKILLIEDDKDLCAALSVTLKKEGFDIDISLGGEDAIYYAVSASYDAIILDRMLPGLDGLSLLQLLRRKNITTPVILVTAMSGISDRIDGLDAGADDYLVKPFDIGELMARIRALVRRPRELNNIHILQCANFTLNIDLHTLTSEYKTITLSNRETKLLEFLIKNKGQILTRDQIIERIWGLDTFVEDGNLDNYIYLGRRRLKAANCRAEIKLIHTVGYQLVELS